MSARRSVFISYARVDADWVTVASRLFRVSGTRVFLDVSDIEFGARWKEELVKALTACERVVVFWSAAASKSEWVEREWRLALEMNKRIVPVLLDATSLCQELSVFQASSDLLDLMKMARKALLSAEDLEASAADSKDRLNRLSRQMVPLLVRRKIEIQRPEGILGVLWAWLEQPIRDLVRDAITREQDRWEREASQAIADEHRRLIHQVLEVLDRETVDNRNLFERTIGMIAKSFSEHVFADGSS